MTICAQHTLCSYSNRPAAHGMLISNHAMQSAPWIRDWIAQLKRQLFPSHGISFTKPKHMAWCIQCSLRHVKEVLTGCACTGQAHLEVRTCQLGGTIQEEPMRAPTAIWRRCCSRCSSVRRRALVSRACTRMRAKLISLSNIII